MDKNSIASQKYNKTQFGPDFWVTEFLRVGLQVMPEKTKARNPQHTKTEGNEQG